MTIAMTEPFHVVSAPQKQSMRGRSLSCNGLSMCNNFQSGQKWTFILYFLNHYEKTSTLIEFFPRQKAAMEIFFFIMDYNVNI